MHHRLISPQLMSISLALGLGLLLTLGFLTRLALAQAPENTPQPIIPVDPALKESPSLQAKAISGSQPWVWILCKFADDASEPEPLSYFQNLYADTYPGLNHYLREVSYNKADITGSQAVGWFTLPQPRSYYVYDMGGGSEEPDLDRLVNHCTQVAEPSVNFPNFYGINLMFNGSWPGFFGLTTGKNLTLDGVNRIWPVIYMDNKGGYNAALTVHEMFHGFGLAHSSAYSPTTGHALGSSWDPVGVGACGFSSCTPNHIPAPQKDILGWITATHIYTATAISQTVTLEALALPQTNNPLMVKIPVGQSSSHFYTVEARRKVGYDTKNPAAAVLIHEVNPAFNAFGPFTHGPVRLVPKLPNVADQPWAAGAIWNVGDTFVGPANYFTVSIMAATSTGFVLNITRVPPAIRYVDRDATGANNGQSWADAYTNLQTAFTDPLVTEIWVAEGTYKPTGGADWTATFNLPGVPIYGGFAGTETDLSQRDIIAHPTILSGDLNSNDGPNFTNRADNSYHVVLINNPGGTIYLDGFTISGGNANGSSPFNRGGGLYHQASSNANLSNIIFKDNLATSFGGGLYNLSSNLTLTGVTFDHNQANQGGGMSNDLSSPTLINVTFSSNTATAIGGGLFNTNSHPIIANATFVGNSAVNGGGIYNSSSSPNLMNTVFSTNTVNLQGGGLFNTSSHPTLAHVTFIGNSARDGGGIYNSGSNPKLINTIFSGNTTQFYGGGMHNSNSSPTLVNVSFSGNSVAGNEISPGVGGGMSNEASQPILTNNTFSNNKADEGSGLYNDLGSHLTLANTIVWGNRTFSGSSDLQIDKDNTSVVTVTYSLVEGGYAGAGNLEANPLFIDADGPDNIAGTADDNLRLQDDSPAIDAGNNSVVPDDAADVDGDNDTGEPIPYDLDSHPRFIEHLQPNTGLGLSPLVDLGAYENQHQAGPANQEITLLLDGLTNIPDNTGSVSFGVTSVGLPLTKTFVISNPGNGALLLAPPIAVPTGFTVVDSFGSLTVTTGLTTSFRVQLDATSAGVFSETLQFTTNDPDENPFNFTISGTVNTLSTSNPVYLPAIAK